MIPNCKIGKVTPKGNLALLPSQSEDVEPFIGAIRDFSRKNGVSSFGFYIYGQGQRMLGGAGGITEGIISVELLKHKLAKEWIE